MPIVVRPYGKLGDIVYVLSALRGLHRTYNEKCRVMLTPFKGKNFRLTPDNIENIIPLIAKQDYVAGVDRAEKFSPGDGIDFRPWFAMRRNFAPNLALSACRFAKVGDEFAKQPWLSIKAPRQGGIWVNRTGRYPGRNPKLLWRNLLEQYPKAGFIGFEQERREFARFSGRDIPGKECRNLLEMAEVLKGCDRLLCNQSCALAIAHGLGTPVTVETSVELPDCIFLRDGAEYPDVDETVLRENGLQWK